MRIYGGRGAFSAYGYRAERRAAYSLRSEERKLCAYGEEDMQNSLRRLLRASGWLDIAAFAAALSVAVLFAVAIECFQQTVEGPGALALILIVALGVVGSMSTAAVALLPLGVGIRALRWAGGKAHGGKMYRNIVSGFIFSAALVLFSAVVCFCLWGLHSVPMFALPADISLLCLSCGSVALFAAAAAVKGILLFRLRRALAQRKNSVYASSVPPDPFEFGG